MNSALINETINNLLSGCIVWVVAWPIILHVAYSFATTKKKTKSMIVLFICKSLIVDVACNTVLASMYHNNEYAFIVILFASILGIVLLFLGCRYWLEIPTEKMFFALILGEVWQMVCCSLGELIIELITGYKFNESRGLPICKYDVFVLIAEIVLLAVSYKPFMGMCRFIAKKYKVKMVWLSKVLLGVYLAVDVINTVVYVSPKGNVLYQQVFAGVFIILVIFATLLYMDYSSVTQQIEELERQRGIMKEYCNTLDNQISQTRQLRHDMNNNLQVMSALVEAEEYDELKQYLAEWSAHSVKEKVKRYSNIAVVDALLMQKQTNCEQNGIEFSAAMSHIELQGVSEFDFVTILFNLLDNAIDGCKSIESGKKQIELICSCLYNQVIISVKNTCNGPGVLRKAVGNEYHGYGLRIINDIVKKYDGEMTVDTDNGMYSVNINLDRSKKEGDS